MRFQIIGRVRFQIITTTAGHHACAVGWNGETVWTTEVYSDVRDADAAIMLLVRALHGAQASPYVPIERVDRRLP